MGWDGVSGRWQKTSIWDTLGAASGSKSYWEKSQVPTAQLMASIGAIVQVVTLEGQQNAF